MSNNLPIHIFKNLHNDVQTSDINFVFRDPDKSQIVVSAHKVILAGGSPVFRSMFYGPMKETGDVIIEDSSSNIFQKFIDFFYNPKPTLVIEEVFDIMTLADKYDTEMCLQFCKRFLVETTLRIENLCEIIRCAVFFNMFDFKIMIIDKFLEEEELSILFKAESFLRCDRIVLSYVLSRPRLGCKNEMEVFNAAMGWAENARTSEVVLKHSESHNVNQELRNQLGGCFYLIRFPTMNEYEFLRDVKKKFPGLFSAEECLELLEHMIAHTQLKTLVRFPCQRRLYLSMFKRTVKADKKMSSRKTLC